MNIADTTTIDTYLPLKTTGALTSSRTEDMLQQALDSDNIEEVKAQLQHVWGHYQSLEFALNAAARVGGEAIRDGIITDGAQDLDPVDVTLRIIAGPVLESAYEVAHQVLPFLTIGLAATIPDALRGLYGDVLDNSDPQRELSDFDLQQFFAEAPDVPQPRFTTDADGATEDGDL